MEKFAFDNEKYKELQKKTSRIKVFKTIKY